jgi:hypothetical protein
MVRAWGFVHSALLNIRSVCFELKFFLAIKGIYRTYVLYYYYVDIEILVGAVTMKRPDQR